jgi:hypothetical protein
MVNIATVSAARSFSGGGVAACVLTAIAQSRVNEQSWRFIHFGGIGFAALNSINEADRAKPRQHLFLELLAVSGRFRPQP